MKKLLVLALSAIMILAFAAVSMAATVTVGGELNFGKSWSGAGERGIDEAVTGWYHQDSQSNVSNAKVTFTAIIADDVKAFTALKGNTIGASIGVDETWVQFTEDYGTIKVGYFGYNQNQKDLIDGVIPDIKSGLTVSYAVELTDQLTLNLAAANDGSSTTYYDTYYINGDLEIEPFDDRPGLSGKGLDYSVGLAYDANNFGINGNYFKYAATDDATAFSVMGYYKMDDLKFYAQYNNNNCWTTNSGKGVQNFIIGTVYDSADVPLFVRVEYDLNNQSTDVNEWALRLAFKMTPNVKFQYTLMRHNLYYATDEASFDNYTTNELLLIATF